MSLTQPSSNFTGYELHDWWKETQKLINQRGQFDYQVPASTISRNYVGPTVTFSSTNTSDIDVFLSKKENTVFLTNPGTVYLPAASLSSAKEYYLVCYRNGNITWTTKSLILTYFPGDYIQYEASDFTLLDNSTSTMFKHIISDGINNWILIP